MEEIKPCPFCGGKAEVYMDDDYCQKEGYRASCINGNYWNGHHCPVCPTTDTFDTAEEAIAAWNTRYERTCNTKRERPRFVDLWFDRSCECGRYLYDGDNYCSNCGAKVLR